MSRVACFFFPAVGILVLSRGGGYWFLDSVKLCRACAYGWCNPGFVR